MTALQATKELEQLVDMTRQSLNEGEDEDEDEGDDDGDDDGVAAMDIAKLKRPIVIDTGSAFIKVTCLC